MTVSSGTGTNFKTAAHVQREVPKINRLIVVPLNFVALRAQLVVLVSAFVMVSTVWLQFLVCVNSIHGAQPVVKLGKCDSRALCV